MATIDINKLIQESILNVQSSGKSEELGSSLRNALFESDGGSDLNVQDSSIVSIIGAGFGAYIALKSE